MKTLKEEAVTLLKELIRMESFSKTEDKTAEALQSFFQNKGIKANRFLNNVWVLNKYFDNLSSSSHFLIMCSHFLVFYTFGACLTVNRHKLKLC